MSAFDLIAILNHPGRIAGGIGTNWHGAVGIQSGARVMLNSHDPVRFHMIAAPGSFGFGQRSPELRLLGFDVAERSVSEYTVRTHKPSYQSWRTFLNNHLLGVADFDIVKAS